jgi:hypothetical protein
MYVENLDTAIACSGDVVQREEEVEVEFREPSLSRQVCTLELPAPDYTLDLENTYTAAGTGIAKEIQSKEKKRSGGAVHVHLARCALILSYS